MNLSKLSKTMQQKYTHLDKLGNPINIGDIVVVPGYRKYLNIGIVYNMNKNYILVNDKELLDDGEIQSLGRGIRGEDVIIINKIYNKELIKNSEEKQNKLIEEKKEYRKNNPLTKRILVLLYKDNTEYGLYIMELKKIGKKYIEEQIKNLQDNYKEFKLYFYSDKTDEFVENFDINDIKIFSHTKGIFVINNYLKEFNIYIKLSYNKLYNIFDFYFSNEFYEKLDFFLKKNILLMIIILKDIKKYYQNMYIIKNIIGREIYIFMNHIFLTLKNFQKY